MEVYLNQVCVTYRELIEPGIMSISNYKQSVNRKKLDVVRKGGNGREALIAFETLPPPIKTKVMQTYGDVRSQAKEAPLKKYYEVDAQAQNFFENYRYDNGTRIKNDKIQQYVANASALNAIIALIQQNRTMKKRSGGSFKIGEIYNDYILPSLQALKIEWGHTLPKSERQLREVLKKYEGRNYEGLISGKDCNDNAAKAKESEQHALLRRLLAHANNFDYAQVTMMYNEVGKANGWKLITRKTVENFAKENILLTEAGRRGEVAFDNKLAMQHRRRSAPYPMMMWTVDGWDAELLYQATTSNKQGTNITTYHHRPTIVVVLDPYHKYPVGYAIGTHETPDLIREALRNALNHTAELFGTRYRPQQLQSDRYGNGALKPFFERITPRFIPAKVRNAKSKVIEPYFKDLNKGYCQYHNNWSGFGVTGKVDNQPNAEWRNKVRHSFPDWDGVCNQLHAIIAKERAAKREAYIEGFEKMSENSKLPWTTEQYLMNAGQRKDRTIKMRGTFQFDIKNVEYHYDSFNPEFRYHTNEDWTLCYDTQDMSNVLVVNRDESLRFLLQPIHRNAMALMDRQDGDAKALAQVADFNKGLKAHIMDRAAQDYELVDELFRNTEQETLSKMLLVDNLGQHKLQKAKARLKPIKEIEPPELPDPKMISTELEQEYNNYLEQKNNFNDYL